MQRAHARGVRIASLCSGAFVLAAAILYLASPAGFVFSRVVLTDAPLTFFFTATLFLARATVLRRVSAPALRDHAIAFRVGLALLLRLPFLHRLAFPDEA